MHADNDDLHEKLQTARQLIEAMVSELRFRGVDDNHKLIRQARMLLSAKDHGSRST